MATSPPLAPTDGGTVLREIATAPLDAELHRRARAACERLFRHALHRGFRGFDPYDGLLASRPGFRLLTRSRAFRLALVQAVRRSPADLRPLLGIEAHVNPKTLGLFLSTCAALHRVSGESVYRETAADIRDLLAACATRGASGPCWGYPFDWQARAFYIPAGTPTVVCTSFVSAGLLDAAEAFGDEHSLELAMESTAFLRRDLNRTRVDGGFSFSYSPLDHSVVHNASALGGALLARAGQLADRAELLAEAGEAFAGLIRFQRDDGSWLYGTAAHHSWVDGFHTGYVLECLETWHRITGDQVARESLSRGIDFYRRHLLVDGWRPLHRLGGPEGFFEMHSAAETLLLHSRDLAGDDAGRAACRRLLEFLLPLARTEDGLFPDEWHDGRTRFRSGEGFMRWTQAWLARALAAILTVGR